MTDEPSSPGPVLETPRLLLRRWRDADREPFAALNADPRVMEHFPAVLTRAESDALVDRLEAGFERHGSGLWAVERKADGAFLGFTGLSRPTFVPFLVGTVEIGWRYAASAWHQGFATEAARRVVEHAFSPDGADLDELVSMTARRNLPSQAVMRRLGMTHEPTDDFEHPSLPVGHRLRPHVVHRLRRS